MKEKRLTALFLLTCTILCACQNGPTPSTTEAPSQTEQTIHNETTSSPSIDNTVSCLYEFFMDDANLNRMPKHPSDEAVPPEEEVYGWDDPTEIPHTNRSNLYGTTYRFRLTADTDMHRFCFRYDMVEQRLDIVITEAYVPLLLTFQVEGVNSGEEFVRMVEEGQYLSATLLHARNMDLGRTLSVQAAFSWLEGSPFDAASLTPYVRYIAGYALHDSTGMIASNSHDTIERMDDIISVYGENPT